MAAPELVIVSARATILTYPGIGNDGAMRALRERMGASLAPSGVEKLSQPNTLVVTPADEVSSEDFLARVILCIEDLARDGYLPTRV